MLTADLVRARKDGKELRLIALDGGRRERAIELSQIYLELASAHVGKSRHEIDDAGTAITRAPAEYKLAAGLKKVIDDLSEWQESAELDPVSLRRDLFRKATATRHALPDEGTFDRTAIIAELAHSLSVTADVIERSLYADLRGSQLLLKAPTLSSDALLTEYERAAAQAVLLRAERVTVRVRAAAGAMRALFRRLKFLRLLHRVERDVDSHVIEIDGPYSLFDSVTKYGLKLALLLPALAHSEEWTLTAQVRWGTRRERLTFRLQGGLAGDSDEPPRLPDEVQSLLDELRAAKSDWHVKESAAVLDLPGKGLCVPDLVFERRGTLVYLEVMGYWSRDAVWRRVELVEAGLPHKILFAVSGRLRVSEAALPKKLPGALYVYKQTMDAQKILERVEALAGRSGS